MNTKRDSALWIWQQQINKPYLWMGDNPIQGYDCSGLVVEGLRATGVIGRKDDLASYQLAEMWPAITEVKPGCLLFWKRGDRIGHVEIVWRVLEDGTVLTIGASGGGSKTDSEQDAIDADAYIKIRPAVQPWAKAVDPFS